VPWWFTRLGDAEIAGVNRAIHACHINNGPVCRELEQRLAQVLDVPHVLLTTSGSAALVLALLAHGVGPGDEVIVPAATFIATAHAVQLIGATVRLADVQPDRPLLDPACAAAQITDRTKAIIAVHLNGCACDVDALQELARPRGIAVIEDSAQAFASRGPHGLLGTRADTGTFSMSIAKLMTTGEGGFAACRDAEIAARIFRLRNQGTQMVANNVFDGFGFNFRFTDMMAAVGHAQLDRLEAKTHAVRRLYERYRDAVAPLACLRMLEVRTETGELPLWSQVVCAERDRVCALLAAQGIQSRPFNPPLSASPHITDGGTYPNAEFFARHVLTLPSGPDQGEENIERVLAVLKHIGATLTEPAPAMAPRETSHA
jgi:dTDP-4-amino-4,6-dideoxygalactose transaminase